MKCTGVHAAQDVHTSTHHIDTCKTNETRQAEKGIGICKTLLLLARPFCVALGAKTAPPSENDIVATVGGHGLSGG